MYVGNSVILYIFFKCYVKKNYLRQAVPTILLNS